MISNCLLWYSDWIEIIPCHTMLYHVIPCHSMWFYVILCYTVYWTEDIEDLELNWSETGNCCGPSDICADVAAARQVWVCKQHRGPFRRGIAGQSMSAQTSSNEEFLLMFFSRFRIELCVHLPSFAYFSQEDRCILRLVASMSTGKTCRCWASWAFEGNAGLGRFPNIITI